MNNYKISQNVIIRLENYVKIGVIKDLYAHKLITREQFEQMMKKQLSQLTDV